MSVSDNFMKVHAIIVLLPHLRVYCKYHYLEGHEFKTPEDELRHFLTKLGDPNWYWADQYAVDPDDNDFDATRKYI